MDKNANRPDKPQRNPLPPPPAFPDADPLLTAREAASFRRQGLSTFWKCVKDGTVPQPVRVTPKAPRWRRSWLVPADPQN